MIQRCMLYVGAKRADDNFFPHYHPKCNSNEASLIIAAKAIASVVAEYLG